MAICGVDVFENSFEAKSHIGYCPQTNPLFENLSAIEHLRFYGRLRLGVFDVGDAEENENLLEKVGLEKHFEKVVLLNYK